MDFKNLTTQRFIADSAKIDYSYQTSIAPHYLEFIRFFKKKPHLDINDLTVGAHMIYGRMPTMLRFNSNNLDTILKLVNRIKVGADIDLDNLKLLKKVLNNSIVGASKLLHFVDPERFAILDSRIFKYIDGSYSPTRISKADNYLEYLVRIRDLIKERDFKLVHDLVKKKMNTTHSKMRTAEIVMFEMDKLNGKMNK